MVLAVAGNRTLACNPEFPNNLLDQGDAAVLTAPVADFCSELGQMKLVPSRFQAVPANAKNKEPAGSDFAAQAEQAESADLTAALNGNKMKPEDADRIRAGHAILRNQLTTFETQLAKWENSRPWEYGPNGSYRGEATLPKPKYPTFAAPEGLPAEFALYLEGAYAWHNSADRETAVARAPWERLLALPADDRRFKSTWAAFMLGKSWEEKEDEKAIAYFKQVRDLARSGFKDSIGLVAASLGLEARIYLKQKKYDQAISLYLDQLATGDDTAALSLRFAVAALIKDSPEILKPLATNPRVRQIITAYIISSRSRGSADKEYGFRYNGMGFPDADTRATQAWLEAVETAGISDVESAEKLALAAYQHNQMDLAARWVKRSSRSPVSQWLQAKLLLREGKVAQATELLARVVPSFPIQPPSTNKFESAEFKDRLFMEEDDSYPETIAVHRQVLGELGVLHLARREYSQALDALLRSGFWMDAAYVAERVLTLDELKAYVDREWPAVSAEQIAQEKSAFNISESKNPEESTCPSVLREEIRYLLARRLTRSIRGDEARDYYPDAVKASFDLFAENLRAGWDENSATNERARALWVSAMIAHTNGMELFGTELQPDWAIHRGDYETGLTWEWRATNAPGVKIVPPTEEELKRASENHADPEIRFHYRYQAAFMGWEAARLMPNNSDETATVLWRAGGWLKARDPKTADLFYKALVRRNRRTKLGEDADKLRWFPEANENGEFVHNQEAQDKSAELPQETAFEPEAQRAPKQYIVHWGESLAAISRKLGVSLQALIEVNALPDPNRLQVGQKIILPEVQE